MIVFVKSDHSGNIVLCTNGCIDLYDLISYTFIKLNHWYLTVHWMWLFNKKNIS